MPLSLFPSSLLPVAGFFAFDLAFRRAFVRFVVKNALDPGMTNAAGYQDAVTASASCGILSACDS